MSLTTASPVRRHARRRLVSAAAGLILGPLAARAQPGPQRVAIRAPFFGERVDIDATIGRTTPEDGTEAAVLRADEADLRDLAAHVDAEAKASSLDSYGLFRLAVLAVDSLAITVAPAPGAVTAGDALQARAWNDTSRLLAVAALVRDLGFAAVPLRAGGRTLIGIPTSDTGLNASTLTSRLARARNGTDTALEITWLVWDGHGRLGEAACGASGSGRAERGLSAAEVLDGPTGSFRFGARTLPVFTLTRGRSYFVDLGGNHGLDLTRRPDAAAYLDLFPEFDFRHQFGLARSEMDRIDDKLTLESFARAGIPETGLVTDLLRGFQRAFHYAPGHLTSLFRMLESGEGDCDQLSLLLACALLHVGHHEDDLRLLQWPDHVDLAIRPLVDGPREGRSIRVLGERFFVADVTYRREVGDQLVTAWGDLPPRYRLESATVVRLGPGAP